MQIVEKFCETKYGRICYLEIGSGEKPLVYLHGWSGNPVPAIKLAYRLGPNYKIIAPYLPGHGKSFDINSSFNFQNLLITLEDFFNKLSLKNVVAIGHSVGGISVYELANSGNGLINKAVVIDGYNNFRHTNLIGLLPLIWAVFKENGYWSSLMHTTSYRFAKSIKIGKIKRSALFQEGSMIKTLIPSRFNPKSNPMKNYLLIWGKRDMLTPETEWLKQTRISRSRVVEFNGGHCWCVMHLNHTWPVIEKFIKDK